MRIRQEYDQGWRESTPTDLGKAGVDRAEADGGLSEANWSQTSSQVVQVEVESGRPSAKIARPEVRQAGKKIREG